MTFSTEKRKQLAGHQLYYFASCPYCLRVRFSLWRCGLRMQLNNIYSTAKHNADLVAGGGKSQVPCLRIETDDGSVQWMYESQEIVRYIKQKSVS